MIRNIEDIHINDESLYNCYKIFIPLFQMVKRDYILSLRPGSVLSKYFKKTEFDSKHYFISSIRHAALQIFFEGYAKLDHPTCDELLLIINKASACNIFTEDFSNTSKFLRPKKCKELLTLDKEREKVLARQDDVEDMLNQHLRSLSSSLR